jgi:2'-5' RNA ligase
MRLFIAIELPKELNEQILELKKKLETDTAKLNITKENHFTMKFLGETDKAEEIKEALKKVKFNHYKTKLHNVGVFPNENHINVIWLGIKPEQETIELKNKIDEVLKEFKFKDEYDFHPHLTLARVKFIKDKEKFKELLHSLKTSNSEFEVKEFKLIKSELTPEGPEYTNIAVFQAKSL